ncbi:hypothetical protein OAG19_00530 [Akkermansiaceae bacterium]|nr:hypothetical protein [Akkermansiaceae bacterium]
MKHTLIILLSIISIAKSAVITSVEGNILIIDPTGNPSINPVVNPQRPTQISNEEVVDIAESKDKKLDMVITWDADEEQIYDFYDTPNWDFSQSDSLKLNRDSPIANILTITDALILEDSPSYSNIEIGNGFSVTLKSTNFTFQNNNGFTGVNDDDDVVSTLNIFEGSDMNAMFSAIGLEINVDSTSSLTLRGAGDSINSQIERSVVNLSPNAKLTLDSIEEFLEQGDDIYLNGVSFSQNPDILKFNGNTGTAIPEAHLILLSAISTILLLSQRRRW